LECIRNSVGNGGGEKSQKITPLLPSILKVIKSSKGTADGTLAMLLLSDLSQFDTAADTLTRNEKIWTTAFKSDVPLLKPTIISKLKDNENVQLAQFLSWPEASQQRTRKKPRTYLQLFYAWAFTLPTQSEEASASL